MTLSFDGTDMEIVEIAAQAQSVADACGKEVFIVMDNDTVTVAIPKLTDHQILIAQIRALRNEGSEEE